MPYILSSANPYVTDVHTRHCSPTCCKYGEDQLVFDPADGYPHIRCTVVSGRGVPESLDNMSDWDTDMLEAAQ